MNIEIINQAVKWLNENNSHFTIFTNTKKGRPVVNYETNTAYIDIMDIDVSREAYECTLTITIASKIGKTQQEVNEDINKIIELANKKDTAIKFDGFFIKNQKVEKYDAVDNFPIIVVFEIELKKRLTQKGF